MGDQVARESAARFLQRRLVRELDPITLRPVARPFRVLRGCVQIVYDADALAEYVLRSGDDRDPLTRVPLAEHERLRLQRLAGRVLPSRDDLRRLREGQVEQREILAYLQEDLLFQYQRTGVLSFEALARVERLSSAFELRTLRRRLLTLDGARDDGGPCRRDGDGVRAPLADEDVRPVSMTRAVAPGGVTSSAWP